MISMPGEGVVDLTGLGWIMMGGLGLWIPLGEGVVDLTGLGWMETNTFDWQL